jgi:hypothetical protein
MTDKTVETNDGSFDEDQFKMFLKLTTLQQGVITMKMEGMNDIDAYILAGGKAVTENAQSTAASIILRNVNVKALWTSLQKTRWEAQIMTREEMGAELTQLSQTTLGDILDIETETRTMMDMETGEIEEIAGQSRWSLKAFDDMSKAGLAAISELSVGKDGGYKVKMHSQLAARKQLAELMGHNKPISLEILTPMTLDEFYNGDA